MGVIIGQTNPLTGDYYGTWGKLRSPILGQDTSGGLGTIGTYSIEYTAGGGFLTDNDTPVRFDMRYDSTTWPAGFWRPAFGFVEDNLFGTNGWYAKLLVASPSLTNEDIAELTGETVSASGTIGTFTIAASFFTPGQLIQAGSGFTPPYPVEQPIFSVGKLNAF
jgi:hypothetical protein